MPDSNTRPMPSRSMRLPRSMVVQEGIEEPDLGMRPQEGVQFRGGVV
jgi:hypothetical protein